MALIELRFESQMLIYLKKHYLQKKLASIIINLLVCACIGWAWNTICTRNHTNQKGNQKNKSNKSPLHKSPINKLKYSEQKY